MMASRRRLAAPVLIAAAIAALLIARRGDSRDGAGDRFDDDGADPRVARTRADAPELPDTEPPLPTVHGGDPGLDLEVARETLVRFEQLYQYPPWSGPVDESNRALTVATAPFSHEEGYLTAEIDGAPTNVTVVVEVSPRLVMDGQPAIATVRATRRDDKGNDVPVAIESIDGALQWFDRPAEPHMERATGGDGWATLADLDFAGARDGARVARFTPSGIAGFTGEMAEGRVRADVTIAGVTIAVDAEVRPMPVQPLEIVGLRRARVVDGSLVADLEVRVNADGQALVQAALFDRTGTIPLAVHDRTVAVTPAHTRLELTFFGKALHDQGIDGPYVIKHIRGAVQLADFNRVPYAHRGELVTKVFAASAFSPEPWTGPDRDALLEPVRNDIRRLEALVASR
jgi:hypothetical protein